MATLQSIPRFLLPRGSHLLRPQPRALCPLPPTTSLRHASVSAKGLSEEFRRRREAQQSKGTPVIPQPDKYRPPSHGKKPPNRNLENKIYGPPLSEEDKKRMATKKYPNMMSPEGTFSHWFLHNKAIHLWITMGILVSLAATAWYLDFITKTIYAHLLPSRKDFLHHPFQSTSRFIEVYKMHMAQTSQEYQQQRLKKAEEVEKRKQYRLMRQREAEERGEEYVEDPRYYVGEDGVRRRRVKRWFGIWE
ncbi:hypothetical protein CFE70_001842 [Pyrenophora teres f. teres 0-1]|uniref:Uncharacterized protein n=2 Tax=Pyrenophora teres f. teres TaxID=97479 RepID=E3RRR6_PYRTT|nr:hypothetical protein PTT_11531 [Pyrenophora teres f. teres 0-1]KAE8842404.1 hypothetical protein HRS9139_01701 [Pyrenophora teres f. teres]KAE8850533.1 hypothetical protein PTNB85_00949 [Pyrenophora teres f. teres]KAE8851442.1 hypothetical protein HRS9122_01729 [Pyrenophora teres f. teres]KAE8870105.1 hypothetical protein PTNB29_00449 [Pyrenophora teres f. teres]